MGLTNLDASYVNTRVKGFKGRLIEPVVLTGLVHSKSLTDFLAKLDGSDYSHELKEVDTKDIHSIEVALLSHLVRREKFVLSITPTDFTSVIEARISRNEIIILKDLIYSKTGDKGSPRLRDYTFLLTEQLWKLHVHLLEAKTLEEMIKRLKNTRYYEPLKEVYDTSDGSSDSLPYNTSLDRLYYLDLLREIEALHPKEREHAFSLIKPEVDCANALVYIRSMALGLSFEDFAVPIDSTFFRRLRGLDGLSELPGILKFLNLGVRREVFSTYLKNNDVFGLELEFRKQVLALNRKVFLSGREGVDIILAYLKLKEIEVQNLWSIAAGLMNRLSAEKLRKTLVAW